MAGGVVGWVAGWEGSDLPWWVGGVMGRYGGG